MKNKKGFVLLETLVVTIFTLIIFTLLYTSTVPLLGKYKDLSYYNDIDITYDLYYLKRLIKNDNKYNDINNSSYQSIKCTDLEDANTCNSYFDALNIKKNDELVYLDLKKLNANKKYLSSDILDYVNRIDKKYDNSKILILKRNDYISFVKWFEPTEPTIVFENTGETNSCGYKNSATVKITCNSPDGFKSLKINNEEITDLENLKSKTIEKTISSSTSFQVTCTSKYDLTNSDSGESHDYTVCEYKNTGECAEYNTYSCCKVYYTASTATDCSSCSSWRSIGVATTTKKHSQSCFQSGSNYYKKSKTTTNTYDDTSAPYMFTNYKCNSFKCKTTGTCNGSCKSYKYEWTRKD